jgi:hypothetical protein
MQTQVAENDMDEEEEGQAAEETGNWYDNTEDKAEEWLKQRIADMKRQR